jgi:hypothetical protein
MDHEPVVRESPWKCWQTYLFDSGAAPLLQADMGFYEMPALL